MPQILDLLIGQSTIEWFLSQSWIRLTYYRMICHTVTLFLEHMIQETYQFQSTYSGGHASHNPNTILQCRGLHVHPILQLWCRGEGKTYSLFATLLTFSVTLKGFQAPLKHKKNISWLDIMKYKGGKLDKNSNWN